MLNRVGLQSPSPVRFSAQWLLEDCYASGDRVFRDISTYNTDYTRLTSHNERESRVVLNRQEMAELNEYYLALGYPPLVKKTLGSFFSSIFSLSKSTSSREKIVPFSSEVLYTMRHQDIKRIQAYIHNRFMKTRPDSKEQAQGAPKNILKSAESLDFSVTKIKLTQAQKVKLIRKCLDDLGYIRWDRDRFDWRNIHIMRYDDQKALLKYAEDLLKI